MSSKVFIDTNWSTDEVNTIADCDKAEAFLNGAIESIQAQLQAPTDRPDSWAKRAEHALRLKRRALQIVTRRRGQLKLAEKRAAAETFAAQFVTQVKEKHPTIFAEVSQSLAA